MATEWYLMQKTTLGGFEESELSWQKQAFSNDVLGSSLAKTVDVYGAKTNNTPTQKRMLVQNCTEDSQIKADLRTILCEVSTVMCGVYLKFDNRWWMVISLVDNNTVYEKAVIQYCKYIIHFVVPGTQNVVSYPVPTINATQYNSGIESKERLTIGSSQRILYLPYNSETICVDNDFRILMDKNVQNPTAWKISQVDAESYDYDGNGLIRWTLVEDRLRASDDVANMLADNSDFENTLSTDVNANAEGWGLNAALINDHRV